MKRGTNGIGKRRKSSLKLPWRIAPRQDGAILTISPEDKDHQSLRVLIAPSHWELQQTRNRREARSVLVERPVAVVVSERDLPDGSWRNVQEDLQELPDPPVPVVASRAADERLWGEVLESRGFDVLVKPWATEEVRRVMASAFAQFRERCGHRTAWLDAVPAR